MLGYLLLSTVALVPQDTVIIPDQFVCPSCSIEVARKLELGGDDGPSLLGDSMGEAVAGDAEGGYWFFSRSLADQLWRFDSTGRAAVVSRRGSGPSEFLSIISVGDAASGGILAYDQGNGRIIEISPAGDVVSTTRLTTPLTDFSNLVTVGLDSVLIGAVGRENQRLGVPVHLLDRSTGSILRQYGAAPQVFQAQLTQQLQRRAVSYADGVVAATHYWEYRTDLYDLATGQLLRTVIRSPRWYRPVEDLMAVNPPRTRPVPNTVSVKLLGDGIMLTLINRPRPNWLEGFSDELNPEGAGRVVARSLVYETVVEHLDIEAGRLLAQTVVPGVPLAFVTDRREFAVVDDLGFTPRIHVYSMKLTR